ncbi:MAG: anhydro-N-acetylmuramic acid kinase [Phycisphaeraceae bacterium]|nr:anhydro-N-acetylmuramic acid kinase [Phycisphaeraceae bacterium]
MPAAPPLLLPVDPLVRRVVGCMTGTSLDGLDAALVEIRGRGLDMVVRFVDAESVPFGDGLRAGLAGWAGGAAVSALQGARLARQLGELHAQAVESLCGRHALKPDLIAAHGQTVWHGPGEAISVQIFDPWPVVRRLRCPVVYDLRQADLMAGGQGAPITPLADWVLLRAAKSHRLIVNLGGICNVTLLPAGGGPGQISGEDLGPCNLLIDGLVRARCPGQTMDEDGALAAKGNADGRVYDWMRGAEFFARQRPRTTGREDFSVGWVNELANKLGATLGVEDLLASAVEAVARMIADYGRALEVKREFPLEMVLAGGGARNPVLAARIAARGKELGKVVLSDELGLPVAAREAVEFAVLGALSQDGEPITLAGVTGAKQPGRAGAWVYP